MDFAISAVVAYLLYLLFEAPAQRLNELFCSGSVNENGGNSGGGNTYADSNRAYIFDGQMHSKSTSGEQHKVTSVGDHYNHHHRYQHQHQSSNGVQQSQHNKAPQTQAQALTHRSKMMTTADDDEFTDGTIISIRF